MKYEGIGYIVLDMSDKPTTFSEAQIQAIGHLIQGKSKTKTAELVGVDRTLIHRWLNIPAFRQAIAKEQAAMFARSKKKIQYLFNIGISTAATVLNDPDNKGFARVFEIVCKMCGVYDDKPQINIIILNTVTPYEQIQELRKLMIERMPLITQAERQLLGGGNPIDTEPEAIDTEFEDIG